jgi:hypothetical protein
MPRSNDIVFHKNGSFVDFHGRPLSIAPSEISENVAGSTGPIGITGPTGTVSYSIATFAKTEAQTFTQQGICSFVTAPYSISGDPFVTHSNNGLFTFSESGTYLVVINYSSSELLTAKIEGQNILFLNEMEIEDNPKKGSISGTIIANQNGFVRLNVSPAVSSSISILSAKISFIQISNQGANSTTTVTISEPPSGPIGSTGSTGSTGPITYSFDYSVEGDVIGTYVYRTVNVRRVGTGNDVEFEDIILELFKLVNTVPQGEPIGATSFEFYLSRQGTLSSIKQDLGPILVQEISSPPVYRFSSPDLSIPFDQTKFSNPVVGKTYEAELVVRNKITGVDKFQNIKIKIVQG